MTQSSRIADTQALIERLPVMAVSLRNSPWSFKGEAERIEQAAAELARLLDDNERLERENRILRGRITTYVRGYGPADGSAALTGDSQNG